MLRARKLGTTIAMLEPIKMCSRAEDCNSLRAIEVHLMESMAVSYLDLMLLVELLFVFSL